MAQKINYKIREAFVVNNKPVYFDKIRLKLLK